MRAASTPGCSTGLSVGPAGVEPALHRVSDGCLAARLRPGQRPGRESNPSHLLDRQAAAPAASQGIQSVRRESHPPDHRGGRGTRRAGRPRLLGHGHVQQGRTESNHVRRLWRPTAHPGARPWRSSCPGRTRTCTPPVNSGPHHRCATGHRQFRGLESNQHRRVQGPPPYQLGDPGIDPVAGEGVEPSRPSRAQFLRLVRIPIPPPGSILGGIRTRDLRLERPAAAPQAPRGRSVCRAGVEPAQLGASGLQPLGLASAQPTRRQ